MLHDALKRYRRTVSPFYDEVVEEVAERAREQGSIGKAGIGSLIAWKRLNASTIWVNGLMQTSDEIVRAATASALEAARDNSLDIQTASSRARTALSDLPGFKSGDAIASAVIYALAPDRMAVYDRRAQLGLERIGLALTSRPGRYGRYMALVDQLITEDQQWAQQARRARGRPRPLHPRGQDFVSPPAGWRGVVPFPGSADAERLPPASAVFGNDWINAP